MTWDGRLREGLSRPDWPMGVSVECVLVTLKWEDPFGMGGTVP